MPIFKKATKSDIKLRMGMYGPPGSGKTMSSLAIASGLGDRIVVIDSEHGSSDRYADLFNFDNLKLGNRTIGNYITAIEAAGLEGYDICIIDSLSHAWLAALEIVDRLPQKEKWSGWAKVNPQLEKLKDSFLKSPCHIIATFRAKTDWGVEPVNGKMKPREQGLGPVFRDGIAYEFDIFGSFEERVLYIQKSRCPELQNQSFVNPGKDFAELLKAWISPLSPEPEVDWVPGAIDWAQGKLPGYSRPQLQKLFDKVQPDDSGDKKRPWTNFVKDLVKQNEKVKEVRF